MPSASNPVEYGIRCVLCHSKQMKDGQRLFLMDCCKKGVHRSFVRLRFPNYTSEQYKPCPDCGAPSMASSQVIQKSHFTPAESDKIEACFLKHHLVNQIPMMEKEIEGLRIATKVSGYNAMRNVSHRVFIVGMVLGTPCQGETVRVGGHYSTIEFRTHLEHGVGDERSIRPARTTGREG